MSEYSHLMLFVYILSMRHYFHQVAIFHIFVDSKSQKHLERISSNLIFHHKLICFSNIELKVMVILHQYYPVKLVSK